MTTWTDKELQNIFTEVARRSAIDPEFRLLALSDASQAILQISSKPLPKKLKIQFVDDSRPVITVPLPHLAVDTCGELTDEELEHVAGGGDVQPPPPPPITGG
jgi:hypothetical protein